MAPRDRPAQPAGLADDAPCRCLASRLLPLGQFNRAARSAMPTKPPNSRSWRTATAGILGAALWSASACAADKVTFLTSWFAQAEHGGFYQAKATGLYEKAGLDVTLRMGGPQVNAMQLL